MKMTAIIVRRALFGLLVLAATAITIAVPSASAAPGQCSAAGLSKTVSGVTGEAGAYLDSHPDVNDALTAAGQEAPGDAEGSLRTFFVGHPQEYQDLRNIAAPLTALRSQCGQTVSPGQISALLQAFA
jgi:hemophore-related protein